MNNFEEYKDAELFHGYEADFSVELRIAKVGDGESLYAGVYKQDEYIPIKKDFYEQEFSIEDNESKGLSRKPWIDGGINVTESEGGITEVSFKLIDPGIPTADGDIEFPWLYPGICTRIKGIFRLRYMNGDKFGLPPREYRGFLKEMKPAYSKNAYQSAEYVFQCSGWEMTRTVRTNAYPCTAIIKTDEEKTRASVDEKTHPTKLKPNDRRWTIIDPNSEEPYLTNKTILTKILQSYEYPVEIRDSVPNIYYTHSHRIDEVKKKVSGLVLDSIVAEPITDWLLMKTILDKTSSSLIFEPRRNPSTDQVETVAVIENKSTSDTKIINQEIQFWFNRMGQGERIPFNPFMNKKFVMLNEPSVTVSGNWQASPVMQEEDITKEVSEENGKPILDANGNPTTKTIVTGKKVTLTDVDEEGNPILYELDMRKLADNAEADYTFKKLTSGENFNFETVKKFFITNTGAPKYPEGGKGYKVYQFHGIEASFETIGNPLAQLNTVYPILGLGKYYSVGADSSGLSADIAKRKKEQEEKEEAERKKALGGSPSLSSAGVTTSGKPLDSLKPKLTGLRLKSLTHTIHNGSWRTSYNFGM